ncbi:MAG: hypothetical protein NC433_14375 [Clostridiales bacterium]|nr:hypothetical protein [Clostridiales bacterium]
MLYIIIKGKNEEDFFVQANRVIDMCETNKLIDDIDWDVVEIFYCENKSSIKSDIPNMIRKAQGKDWKRCSSDEELKYLKQIILSTREYIYYLKVVNKQINSSDEEKFDVLTLRYFSMMRRTYKDKIYLEIEDDEASNDYRISGYLFIDSLVEMNSWGCQWKKQKDKYGLTIDSKYLNENKLYNQVFLSQPDAKKLSRLQVHGIGSLNKIIPCINLDWIWYNLFVSTVGDNFDCFTVLEDEPSTDFLLKKDYIYKLQKECCKKEKGRKDNDHYYNNMQKEEWKKILYEVIIKDICLDNLKDAKLLDSADSKQLYTKCQNMSLLSFLLFSAFGHFIYETTKTNLTDVYMNNLILSAQDFADGLIQLIENVLENAEQGCFSFRIHQGSSSSLKNKYKEFSIKDDAYYLEVLITDINYRNDIVSKFKETLDKRVDENVMPKALANRIKEEITLSGFFVPDGNMQKLWDEYYQIAENATNHYGLQLFDSLVSFYKGFFEVNSSAHGKENNFCINYTQNGEYKKPQRSTKKYFPGTQYAIVLPIKHLYEQKRIGIHIRPDFLDVSLKKMWKNNNIDVQTLLANASPYKPEVDEYRDWKKRTIKYISDECKRNYKKEEIYVIDAASCVNVINTELFSKAMIAFILKNQGEELRIALINAEDDFMVEFTRFFSIFYNKRGICKPMEGVQIFLCDKELKTEVTFAGTSLESACASNLYWANAKGEFNACVEILQIILGQRARVTSKKATKQAIAPFELMVKKNGNTLFENRVYSDLMTDIQKEAFGCQLKNVHMQVGSKMHITNHFFETVQLFNTSLYNTRFAYLIAREIVEKIPRKKNKKPIVLVGYDIYSELLLIETMHILANTFKKKTKYTIFEQTESNPTFRLWESDMIEGMFVIIVPTNTTLTTHGKIIVELGKITKMNKDIDKSILLNIAVILIRDDKKRKNATELSAIENTYWKEIEPDKRKVVVKTASPEEVLYHVLVESEWQEPLSCMCCYPPRVLSEEKPVVEVNRSSVVPMIMAGPTESSLKLCENNTGCPEGDIKDLKDVLCYGHIKRKNNHFEYYFKTEDLIRNIADTQNGKVQEGFTQWLDYVKKQIKKQRKEQQEQSLNTYGQNLYIYDILVAPIHETNAGFMEIINNKVFDEVPIVLYIDSDKEYRDNILSKYSNLTALYHNILHTQRKAIINFHYIDDSINSGISFHRTHSLIRSLFPEAAYKADAQVCVNLFQNIILLINRNSNDSIKGYVSPDNFFAYYFLKISSLRNHHNKACALCSRVSDYQKLEKCSATRSMAMFWNNLVEDNDCKDIKKFKNKGDNKEENYRKMVCIHEINSHLSGIGTEKNIAEKVHKVLTEIILGKLQDENITKEERVEYVMTYFEVLSRPYLVYRKSILDVIFPIILEILEMMLDSANNIISQVGDECNSTRLIGNYIITFIETLPDEQQKVMQQSFIKMTLNSLSEMKANYLMRKDVMNKMVEFMQKIGFEENEWAMLYGTAIKRVITLNKDETKGLWLEYLLLMEYEFPQHEGGKLKINDNFKDLLFYENINIISDAITELRCKAVKTNKEIDETIQEYYFDNFRRLLNLDYCNSFPDAISVSADDEKWKQIREMLLGMIELQEHLMDENQNDPKMFYRNLLEHIKHITKAKYVFMYGIDANSHIYIIGGTDDEIYSGNDFLDIEKERKKMVIGNPDYLNETVFFYSKKIVLIRITGEDLQKENMDPVWILIEFPSEVNEKGTIQDLYVHKFAVRNILVHRYNLLKRLQDDFKKTSFNTIKELSMRNELLSKSKAGSHTPDADLDSIAQRLNSIKVEDANEGILDWAGALLQLASDSLISKLYVECIRDEGNGKNEQDNFLPYGIFEFSEVKISLLERMSFVNKNRKADEPTYACIKWAKAKKIECRFPEGKDFYVLFIIAAIVQNAVRHGRANESGKVEVTIDVQDDYILVKNMKKDGWEKKEKGENGITITALKHFFEKYYCKKLEDITSSSGEYIVKLPLLYLKEENE